MDPLPSPEEEITRLLAFMTETQASDLHLKVHYHRTCGLAAGCDICNSRLYPIRLTSWK